MKIIRAIYVLIAWLAIVLCLFRMTYNQGWLDASVQWSEFVSSSYKQGAHDQFQFDTAFWTSRESAQRNLQKEDWISTAHCIIEQGIIISTSTNRFSFRCASTSTPSIIVVWDSTGTSSSVTCDPTGSCIPSILEKKAKQKQ